MIDLRKAVERFNWEPGKWFAAAVGLLTVVILILNRQTLFYQTLPIQTLSEMAYQAQLKGNNGQALGIYKVISSRASEFDFSSNYEIGNILFGRGDYSGAEHYYLKAAGNLSAPISLYYQLSDLYINHLTARRQKFIDLMTKRITNDATNPNFLLILGDFYQKTGDLTDALKQFRSASELLPADPNIKQKIKELESINS